MFSFLIMLILLMVMSVLWFISVIFDMLGCMYLALIILIVIALGAFM